MIVTQTEMDNDPKISEITIEQIHAVGQELLDEFARVCEENGFQYFLMGGTLLGAIRHKGPIPWDDDVDVAMPRKDFEAFKKFMLEKYEGKAYHIYCHENDSNYPSRFAQLLKRGVLYFDQPRTDRKVKYQELWLDIFPLDEAPDKMDWKYRCYCWFMRKVRAACYVKARYKNILSAKQKIARFLLSPWKLHQIILWDLKLMRKYEKQECKCYVSWGSHYSYLKQTVPKSWYEPSTKVEYGGKYYSAPGEWDKVLTQIYGDYMTLPPIEKQEYHFYSSTEKTRNS